MSVSGLRILQQRLKSAAVCLHAVCNLKAYAVLVSAATQSHDRLGFQCLLGLGPYGISHCLGGGGGYPRF